jgi:cyclophilin family peptidyl-prolyl cis-trans isomerase/HEAT repeat protein
VIHLLSLTVLLAAPAPTSSLSRLEKMARLLQIEDRRSAAAGELERYLRDPDRGVRRRAALAAGRTGDRSAVGVLIELMNDQEPEIRQMSAFALGLIGDAAAVDRLLASLGDSDSVVRARAAEALGRIGDRRAAGHVAGLVLQAMPKGAPVLGVRGDDAGSPTDPWLELRLALFALARLKDVPAAESALLAGGKSRFDWWAATYLAMRLESPALKPVLLEAAGSSDPLSRALAARGLGALKDRAAYEVVARLVEDRDEGVVVQALRALAVIGDPRGARVAAGALARESAAVQLEALRALATLPADRALKEKVIPFVGHAQAALRGAALQALAHLDRDELFLVLSGLDPDPEWSVRAAVAAALAESADEVGVGLLFTLLQDQDPRVLPAVLTALRKARGPESLDTLKRHLEHPDLAVRAAAAENLAELPGVGLSDALAAAYRRSRSDRELEARLALVAALAVQKDEPARTALREAAGSDPSRAVRERAGAALTALGEAAQPPGPDAVDRSMLDYAMAMLPYAPAPGVPLYTPRAFLHTRHGRVEIHLNIVEAPLTCLSFLDLARRGFYDGVAFHRVVPQFVVQAGCPRGDGSGGPGYTLRCEIGQRPYGRGTVGMAHSGKDTGGSQFFIALSPQPQLDGSYTAFGWVASGADVLDKIQPGDVIERVEVWEGR